MGPNLSEVTAPEARRRAEQASPLQLENFGEQASESETAVDVDEWLRKS
jgi:hypothetical protein